MPATPPKEADGENHVFDAPLRQFEAGSSAMLEFLPAACHYGAMAGFDVRNPEVHEDRSHLQAVDRNRSLYLSTLNSSTNTTSDNESIPNRAKPHSIKISPTRPEMHLCAGGRRGLPM